MYSAGLSCSGCFAAYDATAATQEELHALFCGYCGSQVLVLGLEPTGVHDEPACGSVQLRTVQGPFRSNGRLGPGPAKVARARGELTAPA